LFVEGGNEMWIHPDIINSTVERVKNGELRLEDLTEALRIEVTIILRSTPNEG
jgi:hypothetical protein